MSSQPGHHQISPPKLRHWVLAGGAGVVALAALVVGSAYGELLGHNVRQHVIAWASAGALTVFGLFATTRLASCLGRLISSRSIPSAGGAVRIITACVGYLVVLFGVLAILNVQFEKLLVGAGLAGIVLGIAATQSLGNVFAGFVLILTRPYAVGDHIRIRSGALGGVFDAWVVEMSLTYTTVRLDDGPWKIPNSALLSAAVGQLPRGGPVPPLPVVPGAVPPAGVVMPEPPSEPPSEATALAGPPGADGAATGPDQPSEAGAGEGSNAIGAPAL